MRVPTLAALAILLLLIPGAWAQDGEGAEYDPAGDGSGAVFQANQELELSGRAGDYFGAAQTIVLSGEVDDNCFAFAQQVELDGGRVGGDIVSLAQELDIHGIVDGDVYFGGETLTLGPDALVSGNIYMAAEGLVLEGRVLGCVFGAVDWACLEGHLGGGDFHCNILELGSEARIEGDLRYASEREADVDEGATVLGDLEHWTPPVRIHHETDKECGGGCGFLGSFAWWLWWLLSLWVLGMLLHWLGRPLMRAAAAAVGSRFGPSLGWGALTLILLPLAAVLAMILVVGIPAGMLALTVYGILISLAALPVALWFGLWLLRMMGHECKSGVGALFIGLLAYMLLGAVPVLGIIVKAVVAVLGLGAFLLGCLELRRRLAD